MLQLRIDKVGDDLVVTIPEQEIERLRLDEGQVIGFDIAMVGGRPVLPAELQAALEESWERDEAGYRYLADR